jgi:hypothetical protein
MESHNPGLIRAFEGEDKSIFKPQAGGTISPYSPEEMEAKKNGAPLSQK